MKLKRKIYSIKVNGGGKCTEYSRKDGYNFGVQLNKVDESSYMMVFQVFIFEKTGFVSFYVNDEWVYEVKFL